MLSVVQPVKLIYIARYIVTPLMNCMAEIIRGGK
jgi:hypothetical protein